MIFDLRTEELIRSSRPARYEATPSSDHGRQLLRRLQQGVSIVQYKYFHNYEHLELPAFFMTLRLLHGIPFLY